MRLAVVLAAALVVVVVVSAAPPSPMRPPSSHSAPMMRPKRGNTPPKSATIPYSNYRRVSGVHRYRYPLYRKRSYPQHYDYEDEVFLPEDNVEEEYPSYVPRPSLFRERNIKEEEEEIAAMEEAAKEEAERRENELLLNQGYFHDLPDEDMTGYDYSAPYVLSYPELERLNRLYDMEKEAMDASDEDFPVYAPGRKTMAPTATGRFFDALNYVRKRATEMKPEEPLGIDAATSPRAKKPQQYLTSAAGRYWRVRDEQQQQEAQQKATSVSSAVRDPDMMIRKRKKRNTTSAATTTTATTATTTPAAAKRRKTNTPSTTITTKPKTHAPPTTITTMGLTTTAPRRDHRNKRAFSDYFKWEKRGEEQQQEEEEEDGEAGEEEEDKDVDDYLTREYFKTIARSVGQKRMAYGQFEPDTEDKRAMSTASLQDILSNPETLRMVQDKLREAEVVMAKEAGTGLSQWPHGGTQDEAAQKLLSNLVLRMDAIEHMRESLAQLQHLQEARIGARVGGRREIQLREERKRAAAAEHGDWRERSVAGGGNKKRSVRRRLRRDDIGDLFMGNEKEECPVLWWILESCSTVSEKVGDESQVFLPACIKHEICYVCGASQGISGHECDAVLSSALEASCPERSLDCLAAAGSTFTSLSRPAAYDPAGSCANDPCVIHFLEAR
ncbi:uncharacterized protein LOC123518721 isoform X2 [Portunus trituberculatus]|uniref:uncharacterized protein LOC123518721 isoform X2 n=1 Tax=Portunus trituberculatus TaxID=210409 RepID=UPI001E1CCB68|nr:uncharacterized protein LOC123518721 isoform X2 [Portunus trituberculatus]